MPVATSGRPIGIVKAGFLKTTPFYIEIESIAPNGSFLS
jgi:hypothetical protein